MESESAQVDITVQNKNCTEEEVDKPQQLIATKA
jgi:hypothetical protein